MREYSGSVYFPPNADFETPSSELAKNMIKNLHHFIGFTPNKSCLRQDGKLETIIYCGEQRAQRYKTLFESLNTEDKRVSEVSSVTQPYSFDFGNVKISPEALERTTMTLVLDHSEEVLEMLKIMVEKDRAASAIIALQNAGTTPSR